MKTKVMIWAMVLLLSELTGSVFGGTEGTSNTLFGTGAGTLLGLDDDGATFIGYRAGFHTNDGTGGQGKYNTFVGHLSGYENTTGSSNIFLGMESGVSNTTGNDNTFIGYEAGYYNTEGGQNTFLGFQAGVSNITGDRNTCLGLSAGYSNTTGNGNVFLGYAAGYYETGSNKLYIDNSSTSVPLIYGEFSTNKLTINGNLEVIGPDQGLVRLSNVTADNTTKISRMVLHHYSNAELPLYLLGSASTATANFVAFGGGATIGNAATQLDLFTAPNTTTPVGTPRLTIIGNGNVGIGTQTPSYPLHMAGGAYSNGVSWIDGSSREYKEEIEALSTQEALEALKDLHPVKYAYKADRTEKRVGFIAEDVPDLVATKDRKGLSPMDIVAVLTKVVQELKAENEAMKQRLLLLEGKAIASR